MKKDNLHRLLRRQIKAHFGDESAIPENLDLFLKAVNAAYKDYDKDLDQVEGILKKSSQELFKFNKELNHLNIQNEKIIEQKTAHLKNTTFNLQNAEKLAGMGNFTWNVNTQKLQLSENLIELCKVHHIHYDASLADLMENFEEVNKIKQAIIGAVKTKSTFKINDLRLKGNQGYYVLDGMFLEESDTDEIVLLGIFQDVTISKVRELQLEETLKILEVYKTAIDKIAIVSLTDKNGNIKHVNENFCRISGYDSEELLGKTHSIINSGYHSPEFFKDMWQKISSGKTWKGVIKNKNKFGKDYWVESAIVPFYKNNEIFQYISIRFDITEKMIASQKIDDQKVFYETILNNIPVDIAVFDNKHRYLFLNPIAVKNTEVREFLIGKDDYDYVEHYNKDISIADQRRAIFNETMTHHNIIEFTDAINNKDGKTEYHLRRFFPILDDNKALIYMVGFGLDVTDKTEQDIKLKNSLVEKESLLGEIHHRVKNNLALVTGLIEMQSSRTSNDYVRKQLNEVQNRIGAMSLIHEKLYKSANFSKINLNEYLFDLVNFLNKFFKKDKQIELSFDLDDVIASSKIAIPIALIVNELVTNSFKYAFVNSSEGNISVKLKKQEEYSYLTISDNGCGVEEGVDLNESDSLGFKLVNIFTRQLKGSLEYFNKDGLSVTIKFKHEKESINS